MEKPRTPLERYMIGSSLDDKAIAGKLGLSRSQVSRIRRGKATPPDSVKAEIARATEGAVPVTAWFPADALTQAAA